VCSGRLPGDVGDDMRAGQRTEVMSARLRPLPRVDGMMRSPCGRVKGAQLLIVVETACFLSGNS
jgi:hypothetical protein